MSQREAVTVAAAEQSLKPLRFIPFRRGDLRRMLQEADALDVEQRAAFDVAADRIEAAFADEFHHLRQQLKDSYAGLDPDADTRVVEGGEAPEEPLVAQLESLLERANYERLSDDDIRRAFRSASLFQIRLKVDLAQFDEVLLYCRGASRRRETLPLLFGLIKRSVDFINYDRVLLYLRFAAQPPDADEALPDRGVMIKLFQDVPDADLEMLFPNTRVGMRWSDRLLIGVPALASGIVVVTTKLGAPLLLLAALVGFWLGVQSEPVELDKTALLGLAAGFGALGAYLWKQWSGYRNRKARFRQALTRNLYFKLLDNNAGALLRILDNSEDSECKESFVALYFLIAEPAGLSAESLDQRIEAWFQERWSAHLDFEIDDALQKLQRLGLAAEQDGLWRSTDVHSLLEDEQR